MYEGKSWTSRTTLLNATPPIVISASPLPALIRLRKKDSNKRAVRDGETHEIRLVAVGFKDAIQARGNLKNFAVQRLQQRAETNAFQTG